MIDHPTLILLLIHVVEVAWEVVTVVLHLVTLPGAVRTSWKCGET